MEQKNNLAFLKVFLEHKENRSDLLPFLSESERAELKKTPSPSYKLSSFLSSFQWIESIHYSWFYAPLASTPKSLQQSFLSLFPAAHVKGLSPLLKVEAKTKEKLSPFVASYLMHFLKKEMMGEDLVPFGLFPSSELNVLMEMKKSELFHLIDLLGIYDLANDYRQIVDKELLKKIAKALAPDLSAFLQFCVRQPVKWVSPKLPLQKWDGSKEQLSHLLHQRGLTRLGFALFGENKHFQWHFLHRLDTGRCKWIQAALKQAQPAIQSSYFRGQVLDLIKRIQK